MRVESQLATGIWSTLTTDTVARYGLRLTYGIDGNGPLDCVASTGECGLTLNNDASNSGATQGYYSPNHYQVRSGWTFGIPFQVVFSHGDDATIAVTSITRSGTTATVTTGTDHGRTTGDYVTILGANQTDYNGTRYATVTGATTLTIEVNNTATTPATGTMTLRRAYVKHRGKVREIKPEAGMFRTQRVHVVSYDGMRDIAETDIRSVALQISKTETECVTAILDALPSVSQPVRRDLDTGVDTFAYALDDVRDGAKALALIKDVAVSSFALAVMKGDGTFTLYSRNTRATGASAYTFNNTMHDFDAPASQANVYNLVRVTIHPKVVSAAATDELYALPTNASIAVSAGETVTVWTTYTDPDDRQTSVGGTAVVTALVSGTHYAANSAADGSGSDVSANITPTLTAFASTGKWTLQNTGAATAYVRTLKVIGKAIRDPGPQVYEASSAQTYGTRPLNIDLAYQGDATVAQSYAIYVENQYHSLSNQVESMTIYANDSSDFLRQALAREPGDIINVTETMTGVALVDAVIHSVHFEVSEGPWIVCTWGLARSTPFQSWLAGVVGRSEAGTTTIPGF